MTQTALQALLTDGSLAGSWTLDPAKSKVLLHTKATFGLVKVHGVFAEVAGHGTISPAGEVTGVLTVAAASVDTKNPKRDTHLRSADFFHVDNHSHFTYTVEGVSPAAAGVRVTGSPGDRQPHGP
jgi:polyisoprenoid-binding protein YceI